MAVVLLGFAFRNLGNWFSAEDPLPSRIDVLLTCAQEVPRLKYSRELFDKYSPARWIVSKAACDCIALKFVPPADSAALLAAKGPVRLSGNITLVDSCESTLGEILFLNSTLASLRQSGGNKPLSVAIVSCPYHLRRLRMLAALTASKRPGVQISFLHPPLSYYRQGPLAYKKWWQFRYTRWRLGSEAAKMAATLLTWFIPNMHLSTHDGVTKKWLDKLDHASGAYKNDETRIVNRG
jgi:hypothetical protein